VVARLTLAEIDTVRMSMADAVERFRELIVPALADQNGFEGFYLLTTDEGKGIVLTFWTDDEAAERSLESGYYAEQLRKFVTFFSAPPGREQYAVSLADAPVLVAS
jgi:heme-degrading monooxygenase HmoA